MQDHLPSKLLQLDVFLPTNSLDLSGSFLVLNQFVKSHAAFSNLPFILKRTHS